MNASSPSPPLFHRALGARWDDLAPALRRLHGLRRQTTFQGAASVERGVGPVARIVAALFGFPAPGEDVPVRVEITPTPAGETWVRDFAGRRFSSRLAPVGAGRMRERFGPFDFLVALDVDGAAIRMPVLGGALFGVPIPKPLLPISETREHQTAAGDFAFDVGLYAPFGLGLLVRYRGRLSVPAGDGADAP